MLNKIFVGNLAYSTNEADLESAFGEFGKVEVKIITDRETGRSRGFGFATFDSNEAAQQALSAMNGKTLNGRPLRLNLALDKDKQRDRGDRDRRSER